MDRLIAGLAIGDIIFSACDVKDAIPRLKENALEIFVTKLPTDTYER